MNSSRGNSLALLFAIALFETGIVTFFETGGVIRQSA